MKARLPRGQASGDRETDDHRVMMAAHHQASARFAALSDVGRSSAGSWEPPLRWNGVDLRHLAALQAVAERRSFGRAAKALSVTQSAVSHQIAQLEDRLGVVLIDRRTPGGPDLTAAGAIVARHAAAVFGHLAATISELDSLASGSAVVRIGVFPSAGAAILPRLIRLLRTRSPGLSIQLHEEPDDTALLRLLHGGQLELAFVVLPVPDERFTTRELAEDPWCVVVPGGGRLASEATITLRSLARLPLIGMRRGSPLQLGESRLQLAGYSPDIVARADDIGTIQGLVAAGLGVALLPRMLLTVRHPGVAICSIVDPVEPRRLGIAWRAGEELAISLRLVVDAAVTALAPPLTPTVAGD
jgi:DNA-binding transcriptional LysR family regulator